MTQSRNREDQADHAIGDALKLVAELPKPRRDKLLLKTLAAVAKMLGLEIERK